MKNNSILILAAACALALTACGKKEEKAADLGVTYSAPPPASPLDAAPKPQPEAPKPAADSGQKGDPNTPLDRYQEIKSGKQIMYLWRAISRDPVDYEKMARDISMDYRSENDEFKRRDMLAVLKPAIDEEVKKAGSNLYWMISMDMFFGPLIIGKYDFDRKGFPLNVVSSNTRHSFGDGNGHYDIAYSNANQFGWIDVPDETRARALSALREKMPMTRLEIYFYAGGTELGEQTIRAQIMKLRLVDRNTGEIIIEK